MNEQVLTTSLNQSGTTLVSYRKPSNQHDNGVFTIVETALVEGNLFKPAQSITLHNKKQIRVLRDFLNLILNDEEKEEK